jgi:hypothetical protein
MPFMCHNYSVRITLLCLRKSIIIAELRHFTLKWSANPKPPVYCDFRLVFLARSTASRKATTSSSNKSNRKLYFNDKLANSAADSILRMWSRCPRRTGRSTRI